MLRNFEAMALSASLAVIAVSAVPAAASLCMLTVKSILTLPAVAVASTASRGTAASSATFWRIGVSLAGVKSATFPAMVTAILTAYDAGGGALGGDGGGGGGGGDDATVTGEGDGDAGAGHEVPLVLQATHAAHSGLETSPGPLHVSAGQHAAHLSIPPPPPPSPGAGGAGAGPAPGEEEVLPAEGQLPLSIQVMQFAHLDRVRAGVRARVRSRARIGG